MDPKCKLSLNGKPFLQEPATRVKPEQAGWKVCFWHTKAHGTPTVCKRYAHCLPLDLNVLQAGELRRNLYGFRSIETITQI